MDRFFRIEQLLVPAGEGVHGAPEDTHLLSMADGPATFIEWEVENSKKRRRIFSGDLWVVPSGHTGWARREIDSTCIQLFFSPAWFHAVTHASFELTPQAQLRDALLAQVLKALTETAKAFPQNPTTSLYQESLMTTLVLHLVTRYGQTAEPQGRTVPLSSAQLQAVSSYISERLSQTISLMDLAQLVELSVSRFSLRFRDTTGETPHQFVTSMRVERARELLIAGKHVPAEVALLTGFADQSHLTRHVRRVLGVTPRALMKRSASSRQ